MSSMDAEEAATLPCKPIVSDMTVSSKESECKAEETRDENHSLRDEDDKRSKAPKSKTSKPKGRYQYPNNSSSNNMNRAAPFPMRGPPYPSGPPPPYYGNSYGGPPPHHHHQSHPPPPQYHHGPPPPHNPYMMHGPPPYMQQNNSGQPRNHQYPPPPPPYHGGPPTYSMGPYSMPPSYPQSMNNSGSNNDSNSISSARSKSSRNSATNKKRTIEGVHGGPLPSAYTFRRTDSNSSSTSTVTAGNNTSADTTTLGESPHKKERSEIPPPLSRGLGGLTFDDHTASTHNQKQQRYHRRDYSAASTASSLSVGGFSLSSYEGPRVGATEDAMVTDPPLDSSPKRHKAEEGLLVDTEMRPPSIASHSIDADHSTKFEQLSIDAVKLPASTSSAGSAGGERNLFLSLSTSPINHDVDATPVSKNTTSKDKKMEPKIDKTVSIFKPKGTRSAQLESAPSDSSRPSDTPTPPAVHGSNSMTEEHSMLNRHLRNQSFTPLPHLSTNESSATSPSGAAFASSIAPQLSWSIAGDTPSLGDLAEWEDDHKIQKTDSKPRPSSVHSQSSAETRNMNISPHDFQFWKEEHDIADRAMSGTTTPLPVFFDQGPSEGSENHMRFDQTVKKEGDHGHFMMNRSSQLKASNSKPMGPPGGWGKLHDPTTDAIVSAMPPTPMFGNGDFRDDGFGPRSPMGADRRDSMEFYPYPHHHGHPAHNDRVRNLRGRMPPGAHMPPMPLHIPPPMSAHLPMTSPMGLGPKAGLWSPHHGMHPPLASPHHMGSPLSSMAQSKRKCVPLKPPIPSKFQGDIDKVKGANVPEFTSLVNFPGHMSQKQSVNLPEGMRCCVMCGQACPCSTGNKTKKSKKSGSDSSLAPRNSNGQDQVGDKNSGYAIIPTQNKGLCTLCDVNVWVVVTSGLEIKWCKGCKNFRPWAAFGDKGLATKCLRCRERQREKYALQKEEKEKARLTKAKK